MYGTGIHFYHYNRWPTTSLLFSLTYQMKFLNVYLYNIQCNGWKTEDKKCNQQEPAPRLISWYELNVL